MVSLSERLSATFAKTKSVCFGRFVIDVPEAAEVVWGSALVPWRIATITDDAGALFAKADAEAARLKAERNIANDRSSLISDVQTTDPSGRLITGFADFETLRRLEVNGYFEIGRLGALINASDTFGDPAEGAEAIFDMARRLRHRSNDEVPTEAGLCLEDAFLRDKVGAGPEAFNVEHVRVGIRLKEFPDVHLSIYTAAKDIVVESDSLEPRVKRAAQEAKRDGRAALYAQVKFFRRGGRKVAESDGYEVAARLPAVGKGLAHHDMRFGSLSEAKDPFRPMFDIALETGVKDNAAGAVTPSLTDDEAIALWDKLLGSIRVRKTGAAASKPSAAVQPDLVPLGELAATGSTCPQSGWWQCSEEALPVQGGRRQFFKAGTPLPSAVLVGKSNLWQQVTRSAPVHRVAAVWRLVEHGETQAGEAPVATTAAVAASQPAADSSLAAADVEPPHVPEPCSQA